MGDREKLSLNEQRDALLKSMADLSVVMDAKMGARQNDNARLMRTGKPNMFVRPDSSMFPLSPFLRMSDKQQALLASLADQAVLMGEEKGTGAKGLHRGTLGRGRTISDDNANKLAQNYQQMVEACNELMKRLGATGEAALFHHDDLSKDAKAWQAMEMDKLVDYINEASAYAAQIRANPLHGEFGEPPVVPTLPGLEAANKNTTTYVDMIVTDTDSDNDDTVSVTPKGKQSDKTGFFNSLAMRKKSTTSEGSVASSASSSSSSSSSDTATSSSARERTSSVSTRSVDTATKDEIRVSNALKIFEHLIDEHNRHAGEVGTMREAGNKAAMEANFSNYEKRGMDKPIEANTKVALMQDHKEVKDATAALKECLLNPVRIGLKAIPSDDARAQAFFAEFKKAWKYEGPEKPCKTVVEYQQKLEKEGADTPGAKVALSALAGLLADNVLISASHIYVMQQMFKMLHHLYMEQSKLYQSQIIDNVNPKTAMHLDGVATVAQNLLNFMGVQLPTPSGGTVSENLKAAMEQAALVNAFMGELIAHPEQTQAVLKSALDARHADNDNSDIILVSPGHDKNVLSVGGWFGSMGRSRSPSVSTAPPSPNQSVQTSDVGATSSSSPATTPSKISKASRSSNTGDDMMAELRRRQEQQTHANKNGGSNTNNNNNNSSF